MSNIPEELRYTKSHEWVRDNGDGTWAIGITDHAQAALGDLVFVEPAEDGRTVGVNEACCVVESVKAASDVYSPVAGEIVEGNEMLSESPELVNSDPYGEGWLFRLRPADEDDLGKLLDAEAYRGFLAAEE
ncbi:MAG TPA: glycine cleavage system protein GcvH [Gammaproteobacteria bacterium]|nr:glycine cleavage system protein GcvH [Gammaproteobacteria bacterium]